MPKIKVIWVGKTKVPAYTEVVDEFSKRLQRYVDLEITELKDPKSGKKNVNHLVMQESREIMRQVDGRDTLILLDEKGSSLSSVKLAKWVENRFIHSSSRLTFVVGGPYGTHDSLREKADLVLSLSSLTFTHDMCRIILLEQLYRCMTIIRGEKYHH